MRDYVVHDLKIQSYGDDLLEGLCKAMGIDISEINN